VLRLTCFSSDLAVELRAMRRILSLLALLACLIGCASSEVSSYSATPKSAVSTTTVPAPLLPQVAPSAEGAFHFTILYDNETTDARLKADWGFSVLVDYDGHRILFDTGAYGPFQVANMKRLGVDPLSIEAIVISHEHYDHTGGLGAILDMGITPRVYIPATFSKAFKDRLNSRTKLIEVDDHTTVFPGLSLVCVQGSIIEEALVAETAQGSVVITGCAHPGVATMVKACQAVAPGNVALLVGGFHLLQTRDKDSLESVAEELRSLGVERVLPTHCTAAKAIGVFKDVFGDSALDGGVGRLIECPPTRVASR